jgi:hypothetical protein
MSDILIYQTEEGSTKIQVQLTDNTVWLSQSDMVELFQSSKSNISEHIKHVFEEGELSSDATVRKFRTDRMEGSRQDERAIDHYNLPATNSTIYAYELVGVASHKCLIKKWRR